MKSKKNSAYYIGSTENFEGRLNLHNSGKVKSTKNARPWEIIFLQNFPTFREARRMEAKVKGWKSRRAIENLIKTFNFQQIEDPR